MPCPVPPTASRSAGPPHRRLWPPGSDVSAATAEGKRINLRTATGSAVRDTARTATAAPSVTTTEGAALTPARLDRIRPGPDAEARLWPLRSPLWPRESVPADRPVRRFPTS
ncbi:hypothetical protein GCM10017771_64830 [Streptomyces capitiformicae]|uniref:Uncharacterized protein n=1 Tax=Streptomyces capitiformicae TaxID=2014920 RepID=A0A918ZCN0_9ACTN|nr:hypothetical protein GCM10017771_64830 [Streptomyces capitiformicae]